MTSFFFKALIQAVLLFGAETWVVTPRMGMALGGFHTQLARWLTGQLPQRKLDGTWKYTLAAMERETAGFLTMKEYVRWCQNTAAQYIATQSLLDLCEVSVRAPGEQVGMRWWEKAGIELAGEREVAAAVLEEEGGEERRGEKRKNPGLGQRKIK